MATKCIWKDKSLLSHSEMKIQEVNETENKHTDSTGEAETQKVMDLTTFVRKASNDVKNNEDIPVKQLTDILAGSLTPLATANDLSKETSPPYYNTATWNSSKSRKTISKKDEWAVKDVARDDRLFWDNDRSDWKKKKKNSKAKQRYRKERENSLTTQQVSADKTETIDSFKKLCHRS